MASSEAEQKNVSFFKDMMNRRVPQILGIYIGVSWGIIQFMDWLVNRYMLSPNLVELTLVILLSLLPSSAIIAYYHGMPGRNTWVKAEKVGIPLNVVFTAVLVLMLFQGKDLGSVSRTVTLQDETGKNVERVVPKSRFRKKIALFYFKNETGDPSLDWVQYGISTMLEIDLSQDLFIEVSTPSSQGLESLDSNIYEKIKNAGYKDCIGLPATLEQNIAKDMHMDFFMSGNISKTGGDYVLKYTLYRTKNARLVSRSEIREKDIFKLTDNLSIRLKEDLEIPTGHIEEVGDLPVTEIFTGSLPAARLFILGQDAMMIDKDWEKARHYLLEAVREEPTFAQAYGLLVSLYTLTNQTEKAVETYQPLMKYIHKLPERSQLYVKWGYYVIVKQDMTRGLAVLEMIDKLYPEDVMVHSLKAVIFIVKNRLDDAIACYRRILEIDPGRYEIFQKIGALYEQKGDSGQALDYYKKYAEHYPGDPKSFEIIGKLNRETGDLEQAKEYYEKALLLEPGNISDLAVLAGIEADMGNVDKAVKQFQDALQSAKTAKERLAVYEESIPFYELTGQMKKVLEYGKMKLNALEETSVPMLVLKHRVFTLVDYYIMAGEEKEAFRLLASLESKYKDPNDITIPIGYILAYIKLEKPDEAEKKIFDIRDKITLSGNEQLVLLMDSIRGKIHEMRGEYADALKSYEARLKAAPTAAVYHRRIGRCYRHLKQYEKAEEAIRNALKKRPYNPKSHYELALVYLDMGNKDKAVEHLKVATEIWKDADPDYKPARSVKEKLALLSL